MVQKACFQELFAPHKEPFYWQIPQPPLQDLRNTFLLILRQEVVRAII